MSHITGVNPMSQRRQKDSSHPPESLRGSLLGAKILLRQAMSLFQSQASDSELVGRLSTAINAIDNLSRHLNSRK
jgi:hypothetical protein